MTARLTRILLGLSGFLLLLAGTATMLLPHAFFAVNGADLGFDPNLLSEVRAPGGVYTAFGLAMVVAAFRKKDTMPTLALGAMVYGALGMARIVGMIFDGIPSSSLIIATTVELAVGALLFFTLNLDRIRAMVNRKKEMTWI